MLHVICTRLGPGHLSVYVGDRSQHSEENLELHLSMPSLLLLLHNEQHFGQNSLLFVANQRIRTRIVYLKNDHCLFSLFALVHKHLNCVQVILEKKIWRFADNHLNIVRQSVSLRFYGCGGKCRQITLSGMICACCVMACMCRSITVHAGKLVGGRCLHLPLLMPSKQLKGYEFMCVRQRERECLLGYKSICALYTCKRLLVLTSLII